MKIDFVYIEVENFQRDLKWRLKLAELLVGQKLTVLIGRVDQTERFFKRIGTTGLYLLKDGALTRLNFIRKLSQNNKVIVLDEESFSCVVMPAKHLHFRASEEILESIDFFLCSFLEEYQFIAKNRQKFLNKILLTGNPRFKYSASTRLVAPIRKVLIPFSYYFQPLVGAKQRRNQIDTMKKSIPINDHDQYEKAYKQLARANKQLLEQVIEYAKKFPEIQFILRPHPSCNHNFNQYVTDNILVSQNLVIDDDINDADLVIHTNCTTGVDALSNGVPAINLFHDMCNVSKDFAEMKKLMGHALQELPTQNLNNIQISVPENNNTIPENALELICEKLVLEAGSCNNTKLRIRPLVIDLAKLLFRKDRLKAVTSEVISNDYRLKLIQNQVIKLEWKYES